MPALTFNKKKYLVFFLFVIICIWIIPFNSLNRRTYDTPSRVYRRNVDYRRNQLIRSLDRPYPVTFDAKLVNLRQNIKKLVTSSGVSKEQSNTTKYVSIKTSDILSNSVTGRLSIFRWYDFCSTYTMELKSIPGFPFNPNVKLTLNSLTTKFSESNFGQRIFGYLIAHVTGVFSFSITSRGGMEFWLSYNRNPVHSILIASICESQLRPGNCPYNGRGVQSIATLYSDSIYLTTDKPYYIELIHASTSSAEIDVKWKVPGSEVYTNIPQENLLAFPQEESSSKYPSPVYPSHIVQSIPPDHASARDRLFKFPKLGLSEFSNSIPACNFLENEIKNKYLGKLTVPYLSIYPNDHTEQMNEDDISPGNLLIPKEEAQFVVDSFLEQIRYSVPDVTLYKIVNIEKYLHLPHVTRYLIEIIVHPLDNTSQLLLISENLFSASDQADIFCQHSMLRREEQPFVYLMVGVKNSQHWVKYLVENTERMYRDTRDDRFSLIIVDYESDDIDIEILLRESSLKNWILIRVERDLHPTDGINLALSQVPDGDNIFFTADLTLSFPSTLIASIRKRTIQGYASYSPVATRLMCGNSFMHPLGYWEVMEYNLMGMYKSDWIRLGGVDASDFKTSWGRKDWSCVDRALEEGINLNRIREKRLFY